MMLYLNCDILKFEPLDAKHKISFSALCERWQDSDVPRLGWIGARHLAPLPSWHCSLAHVMCYGMCYSTCWYVGVVWRRAWTRNPSWSLELLWLLVCTLAEALTLAWAWFVGWRTDPTHTHTERCEDELCENMCRHVQLQTVTYVHVIYVISFKMIFTESLPCAIMCHHVPSCAIMCHVFGYPTHCGSLWCLEGTGSLWDATGGTKTSDESQWFKQFKHQYIFGASRFKVIQSDSKWFKVIQSDSKVYKTMKGTKDLKLVWRKSQQVCGERNWLQLQWPDHRKGMKSATHRLELLRSSWSTNSTSLMRHILGHFWRQHAPTRFNNIQRLNDNT